MVKKRKIKKRKFLCLLLVLAILGIGIYYFAFYKNHKVKATVVEVIDSIDDFGYELNDNETKYYKQLFDSLKDLLNKDDYDENLYAINVGQLFLADFYDLDSKVMKSDIGGIQFVYGDYQHDFELGAMNSVYKFVESNVYGDRKQDLPVVKEVSCVDNTIKAYSSNLVTDNNAYYLTMNIIYNRDLGYPSTVSLILVHNNDRLEIVSMEAN